MRPMKKLRLLNTALAVAAVALAGCEKAKEYPSQTINGVIAWGAGGGSDSVTRILTPLAEKLLGTSVILVNKTGASGAVATQAVYDQPADGYTLLFNAENPQLYQVLGLSPLSYDDFEPIILSVQGSTVLVVPKDSAVHSYADLIATARKKAGKMTLGISGVGGQPYMTAAILRKVENVSFNQVSFDGDGPLITALIGKQVDVSGLAVGAAVPHIRNGDLRALAIMKNSPNPAIPEVPHITELNPAFTDAMRASGFFYGVFVKKGTPQPIIDKLSTAYKMALNDTKFTDYAKLNGLEITGLTGTAARDYMNNWRSQMSWLIWEAGAGKNDPAKFNIPKPAGK